MSIAVVVCKWIETVRKLNRAAWFGGPQRSKQGKQPCSVGWNQWWWHKPRNRTWTTNMAAMRGQWMSTNWFQWINGIQWLHPQSYQVGLTNRAFHLATWDDHPGLVSLRPASRHCEEKLDILDIAWDETRTTADPRGGDWWWLSQHHPDT